MSPPSNDSVRGRHGRRVLYCSVLHYCILHCSVLGHDDPHGIRGQPKQLFPDRLAPPHLVDLQLTPPVREERTFRGQQLPHKRQTQRQGRERVPESNLFI